MGKSSGSGADPADVVGAAKETGYQARQLNQEQTMANRPDQHNAWGSTTWERTPVGPTPNAGNPAQRELTQLERDQKASADNWGTVWEDPRVAEGTAAAKNDPYAMQQHKWTQTEKLNPLLQDQLNQQQFGDVVRNRMANKALGRSTKDYENEMDFDQFGDVIGFDPAEQRQKAEDAAYQRSTNRLDPRFAQDEQRTMANLRSRGLSEGDQAYDSAVANFSRGKNDAYEQARLGATNEGRTETRLGMEGNQLANALRDQKIQEGLYKRDYNFNESNKLIGDTRVKGGPPTSGGQTETIASKHLGGN